MKKTLMMLAAASSLVAAQPALAATVTNISAPAGNAATPFDVSASQISVDFDVTANTPTTVDFTVDNGDAASYNFDSAVNIFAATGVSTLTLMLTNGATFNLGTVAGAFTNAIASLNAAGNIVTINFSSPEFVFAGLGSLDGTAGDFIINRNGLAAGENFSLVISSGAVPEPASWAMMIAGFALVGSAMRRRQGNLLAAA